MDKASDYKGLRGVSIQPMRRIVVLISGRGSNLLAILDAARAQRWPDSVVAVIADRPGAAGLNIARSALQTHGFSIEAQMIDASRYSDRAAFEAVLTDRLAHLRADVIVLGGFMRILSDAFVAAHAGRLINIHPSLLPAFPGLKTHARALAAGVRLHGATVHLVTTDLDQGPILAQAVLPVRDGDSESSLAQRVLNLEHQILPRAVRWMAQGRVQVMAGVAQIVGVEASERLLIEGWDDAKA